MKLGTRKIVNNKTFVAVYDNSGRCYRCDAKNPPHHEECCYFSNDCAIFAIVWKLYKPTECHHAKN